MDTVIQIAADLSFESHASNFIIFYFLISLFQKGLQIYPTLIAIKLR